MPNPTVKHVCKPYSDEYIRENFDEDEYEYMQDENADQLEIDWKDGRKQLVPIYEPHGGEYVPFIDCVVCHGHEEIVIVHRTGAMFEMYTR